MKPHEETWELNPIQRAAVVLKGERKPVLYAGNPLKATQPEDVERARLAVKAPAMARALLGIGYEDERGEWHTETCHDFGHGPRCQKARDVLREAGVLE